MYEEIMIIVRNICEIDFESNMNTNRMFKSELHSVKQPLVNNLKELINTYKITGVIREREEENLAWKIYFITKMMKVLETIKENNLKQN